MAAPTAPAQHFTLLYFASAASFTKKPYDHLPAPLAVRDLLSHLESRYPGFRKVLDSCAVTVNLDYVDLADADERQRVIAQGDEVALIPPVSSG